MGTRIEALKLWYEGEKFWDSGDSQAALRSFSAISDPSSRILYNIGCAHLLLNNIKDAIKSFDATVEKDKHLALAYWQRGIAKYKLKKYREALHDFEESRKLLWEKNCIDYTKLDLKYKLYKCEIHYNSAVCHVQLRDGNSADQCLQLAQRTLVEKKHKVIQDASQIIARGEVPELLELPSDAIFRADKSKVKHIDKSVDYIGKAKVISSVQENDTFSGFSGPLRVEQMEKSRSAPSSPVEERKMEKRRNTPPAPKSPVLGAMRSQHGPPPDKPAPRPPVHTVSERNRGSNKPHKVPLINVTDLGHNAKQKNNSSLPDLPPRRKLPPAPVLNTNQGEPRRGSTSNMNETGSERPMDTHRKWSVDLLNTSSIAVPAASSQIAKKRDLSKLPPSRPAPRPAVKNKPLPQERDALQKRLANVEITCHSCERVEVAVGTTLQSLVEKASQMFDMPENAFNLWYKRPSDMELVCISTEEDMKSAWAGMTNNTLVLWCYGK